MRRVRSQLSRPVFRLSSVVRGRGVAGGAGVRRGGGIGASFFGLAVVGVVLALCVPAAHGATPGVLNFFGSTAPNPPPVGGEFLGATGSSGLAVSDASGELYVTDKDGHRVQRFTAAGGFVAAWGFDVVQSGQVVAGDVGTNVYEVCTVAAACKAGINTVNAGPGVGTAGQFSRPTGVAVNQDTGHVYVLDPGFFRVQEFTADGQFVRAFGQDVVKTVNEVQTVTVNAGAGDFRLSFDGDATGDIAWNAPASGVGSVQTALNALPSVAPGSVTVTGGPGAPGGGTYTVTFSTGAGISGTDVPELEFVAGTNGLSGGSGPGADTVAVATTTVGGGGSTGFEVCTVAVNCKAGTTGSGGGVFGNFSDSVGGAVNTGIAVAPSSAPNAGNVLVADPGNQRVQEFSSTGEFVRAFGGGVTTAGSPGNVVSNERQELAVSASGGTFTLTFGANTTGALPFDVPASGGVGPTASVENALNALGSVNAGGGSVSVSGGPGDASGSSPYVVEFDGGPLADSDVAQIVINGGDLTVAPGVELSCAGGPAVNVDLSYQWLANGEPLGDANGAQTAKYTVQAADIGKTVQCQVTAVNKAEDNNGGFVGSREVSNPALLVSPVPAPAPPTAPANIAAPTPTTPTIGQNLTCNAGSWGGSPVSYTYQWIRGGTVILETETKATTSDTYTVTEQDLEKRTTFQCAVTASNLIGPGIGGATTKISAIRNSGPNISPNPPVATAAAVPGTGITTAVGSAGFEVCAAEDGDICQAGATGTGAPGQFSNSTPNRVAVAPDGSTYTLEKTGNFRVQKFTLPGNMPTPQGALLPDVLTGTTATTSGLADEPREIAVDGSGYVYIVKHFPKGTGEPPVEIPLVAIQASASRVNFMPRILKVDPSANDGEGEIVDSMMVNPGEFAPTYEAPTGLAVRGSGDTIYASTLIKGASDKMVFRLGEVPPVGFTPPSFTDVRAATAMVHATVTPSPIPLDTFYQFEYSTNGVVWESVSAKPVNIGNGSGVGDPGSCPVGNPATCEIEADLQDLAVGVEYQVRLVAQTAYNGSRFVSPVESFTTEPSAPSVTTRSADWSSGPSGGNASLILRGLVNPEGADTTYRFEYVSHAEFAASGFDEAKSVPAAGASGGHGTSGKAVTQVVNGLDPSVPYHYRLVASNTEGTSTGDDRMVEPASNAGRFVELVSDGSNNGVDILTARLSVSDDGDRALFAAQTFDDQVTGAGIVLPFVSVRGSSGWTVTQSSPGVEATGGNFGDLFEASADLGRVLWNTPTKSQRARGEVQWMFTDEAGEASPASGLISPLDLIAKPGAYDFLGGAEDLSSFVFSGPNAPGNQVSNARATLVPGEVLLPSDGTGRGNLYEVADAGGGSPVLRIVNRDSAGNQLGGACGAELGGVNNTLLGGDSPGLRGRSVSVDGSVVFFTARAGTSATVCNTGFGSSPLRLFKRIDGEETVAVSAPQCTPTPACPGDPGGNDLFLGASMDGSKVYFRTTRRLVNSDTDFTDDLYLYDSSPPDGQPSLVQVSAGESVAPEHPTIGAGAQVISAADVAADGSRAYFIAEGRLTEEATQAAKNLFLYERNTDHPEGRIAFVATLSNTVGQNDDGGGDDDIWATFGRSFGKPAYALPFYDGLGPDREPGDGRYLILGTEAALLPEDEDSVEDAYRYDAVTGDLVCLSCGGDGNHRVYFWTRHDSAAPDFVQQHRIASEDVSRVVFRTDEQLTEDDTNTVDDVYEWHEGVVSLVSGATGEVGVATGSSAGNRGPAISPDGQTVFFETRASLLPQDNNNVGFDWYALRRGGGFVQQGTDQPDCQNTAAGCQTGGSGPVASDPKTSPSSGSDNAKPDVRKTLAVSGLSRKARRRASRTGRLPLVVRVSMAGRVSVVARARIGRRARRVGRVSRQVRAGRTRVVVRLSPVARKRLRSGKALRLAVSVRQAGARGRTISVLLPGGRS